MSGNYEGDNERATDGAQEDQAAWRNTLTPQETYTVEPDTLYSVKVDKPSNSDVQEICSMLKVSFGWPMFSACCMSPKMCKHQHMGMRSLVSTSTSVCGTACQVMLSPSCFVHALQVRTSMLAMGACERIKKLARAWPTEVIASPILNELVQVLLDGPGE